jgi:hypothetical protein
MKVLMTTLGAAILATILLAAVGQVYGYHSTLGFWVGGTLNLPGIFVISWVAALSRDHSEWLEQFPGFCLIALANWMAYFGAVKLALLLRRRFSRWAADRREGSRRGL